MSNLFLGPSGNDLLRKIGRNVVNFQKLEHALRKLIPLANVSGSPEELQSSARRQTRSLKRKALGDVVKRFDGAFYGDSAVPKPDAASAETRLSISFKLEGGAESETQRRELVTLVRERNRLVHHDLVEFDFSSETECAQLAPRLDAQNERILSQLALISSIRDAHASAIAELAAFVESTEFFELLGPGDGDA